MSQHLHRRRPPALVKRQSTYNEIERDWLEKGDNAELRENDMRLFVLEKAKELENTGKVSRGQG